ncbi:MAG: VanZ family protein [Saccharofermentans sp.]|nr:VanZ family protein [Saccharofermentans sp.]
MLIGIILWCLFCYLTRKHQRIVKSVNVIGICGAIFGVLLFTVLKRSFTIGNSSVELRPFYTFVMARKNEEYYRTFLMNMFLFYPVGLFLPFVLRKNNVRLTLLFAAGLSLMVELVQLIFHTGRCETDDLIANVLGCFIGSLAYYLYYGLQRIWTNN